MKVLYEKIKNFFVDRRQSHIESSQARMIERRDKHHAQFKRSDEWYLSASIEVEEVFAEAANKGMAENKAVKRVLIVEDSFTAVNQFNLVLKSHGFETIVAARGEDAITMAKENKPNVVLIDVTMPGKINAFQAARQITHDPITKDIPVIIVHNKKIERIWGERQGAKWYLVKPFSEADLIDTINQAIVSK